MLFYDSFNHYVPFFSKHYAYVITNLGEIFLNIFHVYEISMTGSSSGRADSVMDSHTTGPGFKPQFVRHFLPSFQLTTTMPESVERSLGCVEGRGRISRSGLTQDIKMGSCVFQCDVPHQWIAQR